MSTPGPGDEEAAKEFEARLRPAVNEFSNMLADELVTISRRTSGDSKGPYIGFWKSIGQGFMRIVRASTNPRNYAAAAAFMIIFLALAGCTAYFFVAGPASGSFDSSTLTPPGTSESCAKTKLAAPVMVSPAAGASGVMNVLIPRGGGREIGQIGPLAIQSGTLPPGCKLDMAATAFTRSDGSALQPSQVFSYAVVGATGTNVTVWVVVAPHHGRQPPGAGAYAGSVSLNTPSAVGGKVPVRVNIEYQNIRLVWAFSGLAAFFGFLWAWLLHSVVGAKSVDGFFCRHIALCAAVVLAAGIPILNAQVLSKAAWEGSATEYIGLATLVGAAAIAATPTLRALVLPQSLRKRSSSS